jgi:hypothetical protein
MKFLDLKLEDISRDDAFDISFPRRQRRQVEVGEKFPCLPLLIVDKEKRLVWGHDHFRLLLERGRKRAVFLETDIAPAAAMFLNYNLSNRLFGLNLYEKLLFVRKISALCPRPEIQRRADLDFTLNDPLFQSLDALLRPSLRPALAAGNLGLRGAVRLTGFSVPDQRALLKLFMKVRFTESHQLQIMQHLEEIAFREKKSLARVLAALRLGKLLESEMPQQRIVAALNRRRFPAFSRHEDEWRLWLKKKTASGRVALTHVPFFASEEIQIVLTAKNRLEADDLLEKIK